jgi:hypothetical protein
VDSLGAQTIGVLRDGNRQETEGFEGVVRVASGGTELRRARAADTMALSW